MRATCLLVVSVLTLTACGPSNEDPGADLRSMEVALGAGSGIARSVALAMEAMTTATSCATVASACSTFPCEGAVNIALAADCPLPLGGEGTGTITVTGTWADADSAVMGVSFANVVTPDGSSVVTAVTTVEVDRLGDIINVSYVGQNVEVAGSTAVAAQSVWDVEIATQGTAGDPTDDVFTIDGVTQGAAGTGDVLQLTVSDTVLDPACRRNPIAGEAILQDISGTNVNQQIIEFHSACDGMADQMGFLGGSESVELDFFD